MFQYETPEDVWGRSGNIKLNRLFSTFGGTYDVNASESAHNEQKIWYEEKIVYLP